MRTTSIMAYALPTVATQFVYTSFTTVLPGVYVKYYGLSAAAVASALLLTRVFDAVSDPLIGYLSDRTNSPIGRRKPWLAVGALVTALAIWQVTSPGSTENIALYFTLWSIIFYLGWTMIEIPHTAWGSELTTDYHARNRVFFVRTLFAIVGPLTFAAVPLLIAAPTTEMTPQVMSAVAMVFIALAPVCIGPALLLAPTARQVARTQPATGLRDAVLAIGSNRLFWRLFAVFLTGGFAAGINGTLQFIYVDTYLELGEQLPYAMGAMMIAALVGLPLWFLALRIIDKHHAWAASLAMASVWVLAPAMLWPGDDSFVPFLIMSAGLALSSGAGAMVPFALLGDVVDYDDWKHGSNRAGAYYSVFMFGVKLNAALGGSVAFALIAWFGYDAAAATNTAGAINGLKMTYAVIPALLFAAAAAIVFWFPLTRRRHEVVSRALTRRRSRTPSLEDFNG